MFAKLWEKFRYLVLRITDACLILFCIILFFIWKMAEACSEAGTDMLIRGNESFFVGFTCPMGVL